MAVTLPTTRTRAAKPRRGPEPTVLAVLVTHQGKAWIRRCLVALNTQTYKSLDVLVVDDASPDSRQPPALRRIVKRHLQRRRWAVFRTPRPLGFGGAVNWALSRVRTRVDLLLFLHDDAELDRDAVEKMVQRLRGEASTAIVGPKIVSWDDPERLEEVGMAADRFGYPYKGLEEGEIDLGQHDVAAEVFFVSSTCMLVRHDVFRDLRGFDARMRAFAEDLDLCWRARIAGHGVRVEPEARARHAMALATGQRASPFLPIRYFIRRNRLRAVAKSASSLRLLALIPQYVLLALAEMIGFVVLRQPREILNLTRALAWNAAALPSTLAERARVQGVRRIPDRRLLRYTVRQSTRVRSYVGHQAERLEEAWAHRAEVFARGSGGFRTLVARVKGVPGVVFLVALFALLLGFRHALWTPPIALGELLPFPDRAAGAWRAFLTPWQSTGLGQPGPAAPLLALLGGFPFLSLGSAGGAQKLLLVVLGGASFVGAYRLVAPVVDRPARILAGVVYTLGPLGYSGIRNGALGALVFGAAAPFALLALIRLTGWERPPGWARGASIARLALAAAISAAAVPGSLILYGIAALVLAGARAFLDRPEKAGRGLTGIGIALLAGWALLLPWSAGWFSTGGAFDLLRAPSTWRVYSGSFSGDGLLAVVLGQMPEGLALWGLAGPVFGLVAVGVGEGQRRRLALGMWGVIAAIGWLANLTGSGFLRPLVASPIEAGVLVSVAFAALAGLGLGAFRLDLPRRGLGIVHPLTVGAIALALFLLLASGLPALWRGDWGPGRGVDRAPAEVVEQARSVLAAEARQVGQLRALWVGEAWSPPQPSVMRPPRSYFVTGSRGQVLTDNFENSSESSDDFLARAVGSIEADATDRGGSLLGAFNIRFVVVDRNGRPSSWLRQRDLALLRSEPAYLLFENQSPIVHAGLFEEIPIYVRAVSEGEAVLSGGRAPAQRRALEPSSSRAYHAADVAGPAVVWLSEAANPRWRATLEGVRLPKTDGGWGNAFSVASDLNGELSVSYPYRVSNVLILFAVGLGWIVVLGASLGRSRAGESTNAGVRR
ncbi:MAG: glycosyltransferase family 2 protein [Actinomycetota bacterium]